MPDGVIQDGWSYVIAVYTFSGVMLSLYAASLMIRVRRARLQIDMQDADGSSSDQAAARKEDR